MVHLVSRPRRQTSVLVKPTAAADVATSKALDDIRKIVRAHDGLFDQAVLLEDVELTTTEFARLKHSLGRRPRGYVVARVKTAPGAAFSIYDDNDNRTDAQQWLYLRSIGADVTLDLVVF